MTKWSEKKVAHRRTPDFYSWSATISSSSAYHLHVFCTRKGTKILWGAMSSSEKRCCMWAGCYNYCYSIVLTLNNNETKSMSKCFLQCTSENNNFCTTFILCSHRCRNPSQKEGCRHPLTCKKGALRASELLWEQMNCKCSWNDSLLGHIGISRQHFAILFFTACHLTRMSLCKPKEKQVYSS